jgi:hypothetical protein
LPSTMQKTAPVVMQIHSHQMRPRMPKYLAKMSETMPPSGTRGLGSERSLLHVL